MTPIFVHSARRNDAPAKYVFARHETFHPRFSWLKKGFTSVAEDPEIFQRDDAHIYLGVGKNMAIAIRYWSHACKIIAPAPTSNGRGRGYVVTTFGQRLLADNGWDRYLEDHASLWLLHWQLLKSPCEATAWLFAFDEFRRADFTAEDLLRELTDFRDRLGLNISDSSLHKDVSCLLRMYVAQPTKKQLSEETIDCPFIELGLLQRAGDNRHYAFRVGAKNNLPAAVIVAAALEYSAARAPQQRSISIASLTYQSGSPGLVFKLTDSTIASAIEEISRKPGGVLLTDAAGLVQMSFDDEPLRLAQQVLNHYYTH